MNDSLNTLSLRDDRPLEPWRVEVLSVIDAIFRQQNCPYMLVGATARDLLLFHVYGGPQPSRRTRDIDFGIAVNTWAAFEGVRDVLLDHDSFHLSKVQHRLLYRTPTVPEAEIDVIPFGELASADGVILWPPEMDRAMSVIGFEEALSAAVLVSISDQLVVPVASLPGLAVLKLFAWSDRKEDRDATDLYQVIRSYADAGNEDRLYDGPLAEEFGFDMELAGAKLLGMDVVALCQPHSLHKLQQIFVPETIETLAHHMLGRSSQADSLEPQSTQILETFLAPVLAVSEPQA